MGAVSIVVPLAGEHAAVRRISGSGNRGRTRVVSPRFVADAHRAGLGVQVWTVERRATLAELLDWGVDALITDRPDLMVPLVRRFATADRQ